MEISRFPLAQKFVFSFSSMQYAIGKAIPFYTQLLLLVELNANGGAFISFRTYQSETREQEDTAKRCLALTAKLLALELLSPISILILALRWGGKMQLFLVTSQEYEKNNIFVSLYPSLFIMPFTQKAHNDCNSRALNGAKAIVVLYCFVDLQRDLEEILHSFILSSYTHEKKLNVIIYLFYILAAERCQKHFITYFRKLIMGYLYF